MSADESTGIPAAVPSDTQDVRAALLTATQLWRGGDIADALRWLRRAAESAADGNDDQRSVELARVAADLRIQAGVHNFTPPGVDLDSPAESTFHNPAQTVPATPAAAATAALQAASRAARIAAGETAEDIERKPPGGAEPAAPPTSASMSQPAPSIGPGFQTHHAVRVALSPAPNVDGQFAVHPLAHGEQAPEGWNEALLVSVVSGARLFPGRL